MESRKQGIELKIQSHFEWIDPVLALCDAVAERLGFMEDYPVGRVDSHRVRLVTEK